MTETTTPDLPPPPAPEKAKHRGRTVTILAIFGVLLAVGGFFLGRSLYWSLKPTPSFDSLADNPDPSLQGTVAYVGAKADECVYVIAAAGKPSKKVRCAARYKESPALVWLSDGRLQVTGYGNAQHPDVKWREIVDVRTGAVEEVRKVEIPAQPDPNAPPTESPGPSGETVTSTSKKGTLKVTLTDDQGTRTLLSVGAPDTYTFGLPAWSPDGRWFVVKDDLDRLLVVTTGDPSATRVLVDGGWGGSVTDEDLLGTAG